MTGDPAEGGPGVRRLSNVAWAMLTAVVALVGSLVTVLFTLVPSLKPDPREQIGAAISVFAVDANVTLADWAHRAYPDWRAEYKLIFNTPTPAPDLLAVLGDVVYVRTQVDGYKHRSVTLQWSVYDAAHHTPDGGRIDYGKLVSAPPIPPLKIDSPNRSSVQLLFVPLVGELVDTPRTFVRVELDDPQGVLAITDTATLVHGVAAQRSSPV